MKRNSRENARALYQIAALQGGYFTAAQARRIGYAYSQQLYHVAGGNWLKVERGLFRLRDFPPAEREDLIRLSLWSRDQRGRPQAVVSHDTALTVHDLSDVMPAHLHLTVPPAFRKPVPPGTILHKARLTSEEVEERAGYRVTTPLRTLLDAAAGALSQEHLDQAVREALERGLVQRRILEAAAGPPDVRQRLDQALATAREEMLS